MSMEIQEELKAAHDELDEIKKKEKQLKNKIEKLELEQKEYMPDIEDGNLCGFSRYEVFLANDIRQRYGMEPKDFLPEAIRGGLQMFYLTHTYEITGNIAECHIDGLEVPYKAKDKIKDEDIDKLFYYANEVVYLERRSGALRCLAASRGFWPKIFMIPNEYYIAEFFSTSTSNDAHIKNTIERINAVGAANCIGTRQATLARKRNHAHALVAKIGDAARLACAIATEGPKRGSLPWTEAEIQAKAQELGVNITGGAWKAFKDGMPSLLVKKDSGARPTTPKQNAPATSDKSLDNVEN